MAVTMTLLICCYRRHLCNYIIKTETRVIEILNYQTVQVWCLPSKENATFTNVSNVHNKQTIFLSMCYTPINWIIQSKQTYYQNNQTVYVIFIRHQHQHNQVWAKQRTSIGVTSFNSSRTISNYKFETRQQFTMLWIVVQTVKLKLKLQCDNEQQNPLAECTSISRIWNRLFRIRLCVTLFRRNDYTKACNTLHLLKAEVPMLPNFWSGLY